MLFKMIKYIYIINQVITIIKCIVKGSQGIRMKEKWE